MTRKEAEYNHLRFITDKLYEYNETDRTQIAPNDMLRHVYDLMDKELHTEKEWRKREYIIRHGQYGYFFWNEDETQVITLYTEDQVRSQQLTLF